MSPASKSAQRFVRALLPGGDAIAVDGRFHLERAATVSLPVAEVAALVATGVLAGDSHRCRASREAAAWLRRQLLDIDPFAAQHRQCVRRTDGTLIDLTDHPLARLAIAAAGEVAPFLEPHHVEAGERIRRLANRAQLRARVTMSYDPTRTSSGSRAGAADIPDLAADARRALTDLMRRLPSDCAGVTFDVCVLEKGLQDIERDRGWPRRSAKLVLRIGLDQAAHHFGLSSVAIGRTAIGLSAWLEDGARPGEFS